MDSILQRGHIGISPSLTDMQCVSSATEFTEVAVSSNLANIPFRVGGQMLVTGGTFPLSDACDSQTTWGMHVLDMGKVSGKQWNTYNVNLTDYTVPPEVISVIGGS